MSQASKIIKEAAAFQIPSINDQSQKVKLVTPSSFSTQAAAGVCNLTLPDGSVYKLPAKSIVRSAIVRATSNLTSVGSATLSLGLNATSATTDATLLTTASMANVNLGIYASQVLATATPIVASASDRYVVATVGTEALSTGALEVILDIVKVDA